MTAPSSPRAPLALVTGGAGGLGFETARGLLQHGCDIVLCDVNIAAGRIALAQLQQQFPSARIEFAALDLADLSAVTGFTNSFRETHRSLDILINNAGIFPPFDLATTSQGAELAFGIGFYGHFALTAQLLPLLQAAPHSRVVTVSSISHSTGKIDPDDLLQCDDYDGNKSYSASKLACLIFARELDRRAKLHGASVLSIAAHPGIARTQIGQHENNAPTKLRQRAISAAKDLAMKYLGQNATDGALPIIHAAAAPDISGGSFVGPGGFGQFKGAATIVQPNLKTLARHDEARIWQMAERYTGQQFEWH